MAKKKETIATSNVALLGSRPETKGRSYLSLLLSTAKSWKSLKAKDPTAERKTTRKAIRYSVWSPTKSPANRPDKKMPNALERE